jgi:hypothetical protein
MRMVIRTMIYFTSIRTFTTNIIDTVMIFRGTDQSPTLTHIITNPCGIHMRTTLTSIIGTSTDWNIVKEIASNILRDQYWSILGHYI